MAQLPEVTMGQIAESVQGVLTGDAVAPVVDITHDSRQVQSGSLFVAIRGFKDDASRYVSQAVKRGAVGVISELPRPSDFEQTWIQVENARKSMAEAAAEVFRHPSREINLVGITGTNGKTTIAYLIAGIAEEAGEPVAMTGTVEYRIGSERIKAERTTPESSDMNRLLRRGIAAGCRTAVMEASSQAIDLHRCDLLKFAVVVFTNLTRDHLDYHITMEKYFAAKRRLFDGSLGSPPKSAVINIDDEYGLELVDEVKRVGGNVITYALENRQADLTAHNIETTLGGMRFTFRSRDGEHELTSPLVGRPHIYNILAAFGSGIALGYNHPVIEQAMGKSFGAPGRFEKIPHQGDFSVVVDYAHSDDALLNVLSTARSLVIKSGGSEGSGGRIITVFGCGGDRDRSKRAPMGQAASTFSDIVILTSDNPRTEDPEQIFADIEVGL
ncbi:MAG: UDP-N-acetylmuramoyl-L-alanyl-D-glutamate--2,6-diaminopimelate ligase, partial [Pyrinomonadaceae bacterium]